MLNEGMKGGLPTSYVRSDPGADAFRFATPRGYTVNPRVPADNSMCCTDSVGGGVAQTHNEPPSPQPLLGSTVRLAVPRIPE